MRQRRRPRGRLAGTEILSLLAVEAVDELGVLILQALMALVQRHISLGQFGRLLNEAGKLSGMRRVVAERAVVQRGIQLGEQPLVLLLRELRDVAAEDLGQLEQHAGRDGSLVGLDLGDVAQRQLQPGRELALVPAQLFAQPAQARADEELSAGCIRLCKVRSFHGLIAK